MPQFLYCPDSPRHFWWYHLICWLLSAAGIICILVAHEHYTVDVVVAYYITTRLFWWYHSMANEKVRAVRLSSDNFFSLNAVGPCADSGVLGSLMEMTAVATPKLRLGQVRSCKIVAIIAS